MYQFSSIDRIKNILKKHKKFSYFIFCILEILNVIVLPIPAVFLHIAGASIFGEWIAFLLAYISVFIGSLIAFLIGKIFGKKIVIWCIGREMTNKYCKILNRNGKIAFIIMQLLPFFPDDILCFVAGVSTMSWKFFIIVMLTLRPIYIALACFFGTGQIIPFCGWGIPVWIIIFLLAFISMILYFKNKNKLEKWFLKSKNSN